MPFEGKWITDGGGNLTITSDFWYSVDNNGSMAYTIEVYSDFYRYDSGRTVVLHNPADHPLNPSLFTKVMWHDESVGKWAYCMVVSDAVTVEEALVADISSYDATDAGSGCRGLPHTVVLPSTDFRSSFQLQSAVDQCLSYDATGNCAAIFSGHPIGRWDVSAVGSLASLFFGRSSFNQDIGAWNVSSATDMSNMFYQASAFNQDIGRWDVSAVTRMYRMFYYAHAFNQDISGWDTSSVTRMDMMFYYAQAFNQDISAWDVSAVSDMNRMLYRASAFNQTLCSDAWRASQAKADQMDMFSYTDGGQLCPSPGLPGAPTFQSTVHLKNVIYQCLNYDATGDCAAISGHPIGQWDVSAVGSMASLFSGRSSFNQDIGAWNVSSATDMSNMFYQASAFNQDIGAWNVSAVTRMYRMFSGASAFNQDIGRWDVSAATDMSYAFHYASVFNQDISGWDVSAVTNMRYMLYRASAFNQTLCSDAWRASQAKADQMDMFSYTDGGQICPRVLPGAPTFQSTVHLKNVIDQCLNYDATGDCAVISGHPIGQWDVSAVGSMASLFSSRSSFNQDIGAWDMSSATDMSNMFYQASAFNQDIGAWNVSAVTRMYRMFSGASAFNQDISGWDTSSVTRMDMMFYYAQAFNQDISAWDVSAVSDMNRMLYRASAFNQTLCSDAWRASQAKADQRDMFSYTDGGQICPSPPFPPGSAPIPPPSSPPKPPSPPPCWLSPAGCGRVVMLQR